MDFKERFKGKVSRVGKLGEISIDSSKSISKSVQPQKNHKSVMQVSANNIIRGGLKNASKERHGEQYLSPVKSRTQEPVFLYSEVERTPEKPKPNQFYSAVSQELSPAEVYQQRNQLPRKANLSARHPNKSGLSNIDSRSEAISELETYSSRKNYAEYTPYSLMDYRNSRPEKYYELGGLGPYNIGTEEWKKRKEMQNRREQYAKSISVRKSSMLNKNPSFVEKPHGLQKPSEQSPSPPPKDYVSPFYSPGMKPRNSFSSD